MNYDIKNLHNVLLEITDYIFKICEENNLNCMLLFGSALGAYRHHGFIPWDDDMDVGMPREDYEKFIEIMKSKNDGYSIQNEDTEKNYFLSFSKVRKDDTLFLEKAAVGLYEHNGIYVDIFPLDYVENQNKLSYKVKAYYITYIKHILKVSACPDVYKAKLSKSKFAAEKILCLPTKFISRKNIVKHLHKIMKSCGNKENATYFAKFDMNLSRQLVPVEFCIPTKQLCFKDKMFPAPGKTEKYLENTYGASYMVLPPEAQRQTHTPLKIEF